MPRRHAAESRSPSTRRRSGESACASARPHAGSCATGMRPRNATRRLDTTKRSMRQRRPRQIRRRQRRHARGTPKARRLSFLSHLPLHLAHRPAPCTSFWFSGPCSPPPGLNTLLTAKGTFNSEGLNDPELIELARVAFSEQQQRAIAKLKRHDMFVESPPPIPLLDVHGNSGSSQQPPVSRLPAPRMVLVGRSGVIPPVQRA